MKNFLLFLVFIILSSCSSIRSVSELNLSVEDKINLYIKKYAPAATKNMRFYKIPASITLAQGILESGYGQGTLAKKQIIILGLNVIKDGKENQFLMMMMKKANALDHIKIL